MTTAVKIENPEIIEMETIYVVGASKTYAREDFDKMSHQWSDFKSKSDDIPNKFGHTMYGVATNMKHDGHMDYICAVEVENLSNVPDHMTGLTIDPQTYARFEFNGPINKISDTWSAIMNDWFPNQGNPQREVLQGAPMFERYGQDFNLEKREGRVEIFIPLK